MSATIRVELPHSLCVLAKIGREVVVTVDGEATQRTLLDALEMKLPVLRGTIREHVSKRRRPFVRFFACEQDISHESPDALLPDAVAEAREVFMVVGAIAGG